MNEAGVFEQFLATRSLRRSRQRDRILSVFLGIEKHLTIEELWAAVRGKYPSVGYATVYRTLKLLSQSGLCREVRFADGTTRYEHGYGHGHHDHVICTACGRCLEVVDDEIERLQKRLVEKHGFSFSSHQMNLYGVCADCRRKG